MSKVTNTPCATSVILSLVDGAGRTLPEYQINGRSIVVVEPDQPFRVKVAMLGRPKKQKNRPFQADVYVDGTYIDYKPAQHLSNRVSFFPHGSFLEATTLATAEVDSDAVRESPVGTVKVDVYDMRYSHSEKRSGPHGSTTDNEEEADDTGTGAGTQVDVEPDGVAPPALPTPYEVEEVEQTKEVEEETMEVEAEEETEREESQTLSAYERERLQTIRANKKKLRELGLDKPIAAAAANAAAGAAVRTPPKLKRTLLFCEEIDEREKKRLCARLVEPDTKMDAVAVPLGDGEARTAYRPPARVMAESVSIWSRSALIASLKLEYTDEAGLRKAGYIPPGLVGSSSEPISIDE